MFNGSEKFSFVELYIAEEKSLKHGIEKKSRALCWLLYKLGQYWDSEQHAA